MADFVIKKGGQETPVFGINLTPDAYAAQLKQYGYSIVSADGEPYVPKPTYPGRGTADESVLDPGTGERIKGSVQEQKTGGTGNEDTTAGKPYPFGELPPDSYEGKRLRVYDPDADGGNGKWIWLNKVSEIEDMLMKPRSAVEIGTGADKRTIKNTGTNRGGIQEAPRLSDLAHQIGPFDPERVIDGKKAPWGDWVASRGLLINGLPINFHLDPDSLTDKQKEYMAEIGVPESGWDPDYRGSQTPWSDDPFSENELGHLLPTYETPAIPETAIGETTIGETAIDPLELAPSERVQGRFGEDFDQWYRDTIGAQAQNVGRYYDFPTPLSPAAQMDIYGTGAGIGAFGAQRPMVRGPQNLTLVNTQTGAQEIVPLDDTPQTSALINDLMQQGFVSQGITDAPAVQAQGYGGIPQPTAQTPQQFEALQFLLSGQGFDPATMSRMRARATDAAAMAGRSGAGTARLLGQQAGLAGSPAAMALEAGVRRQQGDATTRALNEIEIANAMQGMQNRVTGAGMELNRQTSGAAMANQMALSNASNILSGMQQNVANVQQTHMTNIGNVVGQGMTRAGQQTGLYGQGSQAYNQAALGLAGQAPFFNAANQNAWSARQAELDRERALANAGFQRQQQITDAGFQREQQLTNAEYQRQMELANAGFGFQRYAGDRDWLGRLAANTGGDFYGLGSGLYGAGGFAGGSPWGNLFGGLWNTQRSDSDAQRGGFTSGLGGGS
jgi:hypothetical protein